jgi:hypothetical protein
MEHQEAIKASRQKRLVPDDKFDRHMKRARTKDIESRKAIFDLQTQESVERREQRIAINSSTY